MREILFRGKAINRDKGEFRTKYKNGDWVYGLITRPYKDMFPTLPMEFRNENGVDGIEVDYKTVGQFTGLTDKNGKKIFEGDIIKSKSGNTYLIHFNDGSFAFADKDRIVVNYSLDDSEFGIAYKGICDGHEVIGNVFDNPELLEKDNA